MDVLLVEYTVERHHAADPEPRHAHAANDPPTGVRMEGPC